METFAGILEKVRSERDPRQAVVLLMQSIAAMVRDEVSKKIVEIVDDNHEAYVKAVFESPDQPDQPQQPRPLRILNEPQTVAPRAVQPKDDKNA